MNYEKAYNEALQLARTYYDKGTNEFLDTIFPELAESEDEKIRKGLSKFLWDVANGEVKSMPSASQCQEWIAYIEEQKDQKPVKIHIDNPNVQKFDPDMKVTTSDSSADGKALLYVSNKSYNIGYRDGVNSVKPAEWSEEDEEKLNWYINLVICQDSLSSEWKKEVLDWLKSLRPRLSDEEIKKIRSEEYTKGFNDAVSKAWKPSEEQVWALQCAIVLLDVRKASEHDISLLRSLHNDLNKLK